MSASSTASSVSASVARDAGFPPGAAAVPGGAGAGADDKDDTRALVWSADGAQQMQLDGTVQELEAGAFSRDGTMIVGEGKGGRATVWNAQSGAVLAAFGATRILGIHGSFSPDGNRLYLNSERGAGFGILYEITGPWRGGTLAAHT